MTETTHTPLPYECFQDRSYYDMWCVRRVNEREWGKGFHLVNGEEAAALRDMLNTRAGSHHRLVEALGPFAEQAEMYDECEEHKGGCPDGALAGECPSLTVGDFRRARAALGEKP